MKTKLSLVALTALLFTGLPLRSSSAYVAVSVGIAPPPIVAYEQPLCPGPGYIWTPGYWAYGDFGYYWVPGVWVLPPAIGLYWTPAYWAYRGGRYTFIDGYWGPTIGFYGGINYGYGYYGHGYVGGRWVGSDFHYNTAVTRVNTKVVRNTYVNKSVVQNSTGKRASFNGPGGTNAKPNSREQAATKAERKPPTAAQRSEAEKAKNNPAAQAKNRNPERANTREARNKPEAGTTAGSRSADQDRNANGRKARANTEKKTETSRRTAKAADNNRARVNRDQKPAQTRHTAETRKAKGPSHTTTRQKAPRQSQMKAGSRGSERGPAKSSDNAKKKKKKKDQGQGG